MRMGRRWAFGVGLAVVVAGACSTEKHRAQAPAFSADRLGDPDEDDPMADLLAPEEREAVERSGISKGPRLEDDDEELPTAPKPAAKEEPQGALDRAADTAGKVGVALLSVGVTLGALAAPFFLF